MAKAILIVHRRGCPSLLSHGELEILRRRLLPDHISPHPTLVRQERGVTAIVLNPNGASRMQETSIWLGAGGEKIAWQRVGAPLPAGTFGLLRANDVAAELVADAAATRSLWYCQTRDRFIASTSQRAIVALLGDFQPDENVVPWMLSSGTLGPHGGWDQRLRLVEPGQRVCLDRASWKISVESQPVRIEPDERTSPAKQLDRLKSLTLDICRRIELDPARWIVPLSGGVDSRGLLYCLGSPGRWQTVTWGAERDEQLKLGDIEVAELVARGLKSRHRFRELSVPDESREKLVQRFLVAGEGRVAAMSGYSDGFAVWKSFHEEGVDGVVRGDEAFGLVPPPSSFEARRNARLLLCDDYFTKEQIARFDLAAQPIPASLARRRDEPLSRWTDRLYQQFRLPRFCSALTDLKSSYVEVSNPFLAAELVAFVRQLPDRLRADKRLWREWVRTVLPRVPFAIHPTVSPLEDLLNDTAMLEVILEELSRDCLVLSPALRQYLRIEIAHVLQTAPGQRERAVVRRRYTFLPRRLKALFRPAIRRNKALPSPVLAFRAMIVSRMNAMLTEDSESLIPRLQQTAAL